MTVDRSDQLEELVGAYRAALDGLVTATAELPIEAWEHGTGCPGWTVHDQLAHCVGLERRLLGDPDRDPDVEVPDLPHVRHDVGRFVERDVEARRRMRHDELVTEAREAFARRSGQLGALTADDLGAETDTLMGRMRGSQALRLRIFDLVCHERDIRAATDRLEGLAGAHVAIGVEQSVRAWARTAPTRLEDGDTIRFVLDDRSLDLDLGTGTLAPGDSATTTVSASVRLRDSDVLAIASGRTDAPSVDRLPHDGDAGLVARFLAAASITP